MKSSYIILCFSINIIASSTDIFHFIKTKQKQNKINELLSENDDLCLCLNHKKQTPLMAAITTQNKDLAQTIIRYTDERSVNIQDDQGNTALHYAFMYNMPIGLFLINLGAKIDLPNHKKETPVHLAATDKEKFDNILFTLPTLPTIDLAAQDIDGNTALHIAAKYKQVSIVQQLAQNKKLTTTQNNFGFIPLHIAIIIGHIPLCLLDDTTSYNIQDYAGYTALHLAILFHNKKTFNLQNIIQRLEQHTDLTLKNETGETAYKLAQKFTKLDTLTLKKSNNNPYRVFFSHFHSLA